MSQKVIAVSCDVQECGKRVSDSKKRFIWRFKIGQKAYDLQIVSSALSGKRIVTLNDLQIYSEQNLLNINFQFNHNIAGHSLRIFKEQETLHNYNLRIDNRSFDYLIRKKDMPVSTVKETGKYNASSADPFSEFEKVASSANNKKGQNDFGDFGDFGSFQWQKIQSKNAKKVEKDEFGFEFTQPQNSQLGQEIFQTNNIPKIENKMNFENDLRNYISMS